MANPEPLILKDLEIRINDLKDAVERSQHGGTISAEQHNINRTIYHTLTRMLAVLRELATK
jgi:hypothetical protein